MIDLANKQVLVVGLGNRGRPMCEYLHRHGATVTGVDHTDHPVLRAAVAALREAGIKIELGVSALPNRWFDFAVISPGVPPGSALMKALEKTDVPVIGELELGFQQTKCLALAIAGTNGKGTTAEMVERILTHAHRKTIVAGHAGQSVCAVADQTHELDYLILQVNALQLERVETLRPSVAVVLNLGWDFQERFATADDYARVVAKVFQNQQSFDWAIVQSEALARLRSLGVKPRAKIVTFSATDESADIHLERGLLLSRLDDWAGPLLNMDQCRVRGPHNAENLMAALAVGRALRIPLDQMIETLKTYDAGAHRCELVAEVNDVQFINDSKATNLDALDKALRAARPGHAGQPNVWLIAGGVDRGESFHDVGPQIAQRVKGAFLIGECSDKVRAAWGLFTPCTAVGSLLEAVTVAANSASAGDVVLLSPACPSFDQFRNYQQRGEEFCAAVKTISRGVNDEHPNKPGRISVGQKSETE
ncbi:MAG: UDP-N-acetylmuramoyl-L-alanine--D-glutamate ligase [Verrucomicrobia bacterium]|nr:MAG: UDP-N-acetylmuramoyl-L-alanine--D-glutamate ligase [Verrucomicrobiota bacterium]